ncbi:MAG TPA: hypothetical protein VNO52_13180 [Methylomirabilota bacterium]|nr:hypothetical protein [Methylomirabilota bacterium]
MKKLNIRSLTALALGGLVFAGSVAQAQDNQPRRPGGAGGLGVFTQRIMDELGLSDDQKPKVQAALQEQGEKMRELFQNQGLSREDRAAKMREIGEATTAKLKTILTAEQFAKYEQSRQQALAGFAGRGFGGGPERVEQMAKELGLSDEQKKQIQAVYDEQTKKMQELRENQSLSREDRFAKYRELAEATNAKIKPILNAEQQEKWAKMQQNRGPGGDQPRRRPEENK